MGLGDGFRQPCRWRRRCRRGTPQRRRHGCRCPFPLAARAGVGCLQVVEHSVRASQCHAGWVHRVGTCSSDGQPGLAWSTGHAQVLCMSCARAPKSMSGFSMQQARSYAVLGTLVHHMGARVSRCLRCCVALACGTDCGNRAGSRLECGDQCTGLQARLPPFVPCSPPSCSKPQAVRPHLFLRLHLVLFQVRAMVRDGL